MINYYIFNIIIHLTIASINEFNITKFTLYIEKNEVTLKSKIWILF